MLKSAQSYEEIMSDLRNKIYHPIYFLTGDEPYYIDRITEFASKNILSEEEKAFNQTIIYGKDADAVSISNTAKRFPMMANQQVVIIKEAQDVKDFENLVFYFENPLKSTILFLNYKYKNIDKRLKVYKALRENAVIFESKKLYDDKIAAWIASHLKSKNYQIEPKAAVLLNEFLGNDLSKIANEIEKLIITLPDGMRIITVNHIEKNIGISKEYNNFELQKALVSRDPVKANRIIRYFADNQKNIHISQTITHLYFFFTKILMYHFLKDKSRQNVAANLNIHPYFVTEYERAGKIFNTRKTVSVISLLREYDMKSKGFGNTSADPGDLLKELIYKIIH
jgi:DNA polymerase-3 subunit delta